MRNMFLNENDKLHMMKSNRMEYDWIRAEPVNKLYLEPKAGYFIKSADTVQDTECLLKATKYALYDSSFAPVSVSGKIII